MTLVSLSLNGGQVRKSEPHPLRALAEAIGRFAARSRGRQSVILCNVMAGWYAAAKVMTESGAKLRAVSVWVVFG